MPGLMDTSMSRSRGEATRWTPTGTHRQLDDSSPLAPAITKVETPPYEDGVPIEVGQTTFYMAYRRSTDRNLELITFDPFG
jgi:hypothetical protein